jgi:fructose-bisphosphate aldolase class II
MALCKVGEIERMADEANTSVIAFNCIDYNTVKSVIETAEELNYPVICMLYPEHCTKFRWTTPASFAAMVRDEAAKVSVPVGLHLDHCTDFDYIVQAIQAGFTSVMFDGSMLPVEENIARTREVVRVAHALGAEVEAELGHVGFAATVSDQHDVDKYTKPEVAKEFCERSGCDAVAVAIGSAHGFYKEEPKLDLHRLEEINAATDVPLVLHGGSGIPNDQLEQAFRRGINKFNVGTEFLWLYYQTIKEYSGPDIFDLANVVQNALKAYLRQKMRLSKF